MESQKPITRGYGGVEAPLSLSLGETGKFNTSACGTPPHSTLMLNFKNTVVSPSKNVDAI